MAGILRPTVESLRKLDLADLERLELVNAGDQKAIGSTLVELRNGGLLIYYFSPDRTEEPVSFVYTATQFGGWRRWLSCPDVVADVGCCTGRNASGAASASVLSMNRHASPGTSACSIRPTSSRSEWLALQQPSTPRRLPRQAEAQALDDVPAA